MIEVSLLRFPAFARCSVVMSKISLYLSSLGNVSNGILRRLFNLFVNSALSALVAEHCSNVWFISNGSFWVHSGHVTFCNCVECRLTGIELLNLIFVIIDLIWGDFISSRYSLHAYLVFSRCRVL